MLPRIRRISRADFNIVQSQKRTLFSECVSFAYHKKNDTSPSQFSCVVSKKVARKAVERNTIRRQVYGILMRNIDRIKGGYMGIFYIKKEFLGLGTDAQKDAIISLLDKAKIYE